MKIKGLAVNSMDHKTYDPVSLLTKVKHMLNIKTDYELAKRFGTHTSQISKLRNRQLGVSPSIMLIIHIETGLSFNEIRSAAGLPLYFPKGKENV